MKKLQVFLDNYKDFESLEKQRNCLVLGSEL